MSKRFFSCYPDQSRAALAMLFGVQQPAVTEWASKGIVPWSKLKYLSDSQAVSWDWLFEERDPKASRKKPKVPDSLNPKFDNEEITARFFSLYPNMTQTQIAAALKISVSSVNNWKRNKAKISWERLSDAVDAFSLRWDWLLDGLEPQYRRQRK